MSYISHYISCCILLLLGLSGCVQEETPVPVPTPSPEKEKITLYFRDASRPSTRALNDSLESVVETVDLLIFKYADSTQPLLAERISINQSDIRAVADDYTKKEFTFSIDRTNDYYQFVLLANVRKEVDAYMNAGTRIGEKKNDLSAGIISESQGLWNVTPGSQDFRYIPMWGESAGAKTIMQLNQTEIKLYRSLVRVDVKVDGGVPFTLKNVYVYNRPLRGRIMPNPETWNEAQNRFTAPSLPAQWSIVNPAGGVPIDKFVVSNNALVHEIYLYETQELTTQKYMDATSLVLGGEYNGGKTLYYRVDFAGIPDMPSDPNLPPDWWATPPASGEGGGGMVGAGDIFHPLIRNHHYEISITGVKGAGKATPADASKALGSQLSFELLTWDNQNQNVIIDNNSYTLEVTPSIVAISQAQPGEITFSTNYPNPTWRLTQPSADWFECSLSGNKITVSFKASAALPPKGSEGYFRLQLWGGTALKVSQQIKVVFN
jgi:hypothetical protein